LATVRRALGWITLAIAFVLVVSTYLGPGVCRTETSPNGSVVTSCGPLGVGDILLVFPLLLAAFVLIPELSELTLGGMGVKKHLEEVQREVGELRLQIVQAQDQAQAQNQTTTINVGDPAAANANVVEIKGPGFQQAFGAGMAQVRREPDSPESEQTPGDAGHRASEAVLLEGTVEALSEPLPTWRGTATTLTGRRAVREAQLLRMWALLQSYVVVADDPSLGRFGPDQVQPAMSAIRSWRLFFSGELLIVRGVARAAGSLPDTVSDERVESTLALSRTLYDELDKVLRAHGAAHDQT
jgi:hypothetical protein